MRIVAVQTGLSPKSVLGGTITDREFLTRLANRGAEIHVLAEEGQPIIEHANLVHHYWRRRWRRWRPPYTGNLDVALDLRRLIPRLGDVDWVRFNSPYSVGMGTVLARCGVPIWGSYLHCEGDDYPFRKWVDSWLPRYCDLVTCLSEDTRRDVVKRCPRADRPSTTVIPIGIDTSRFDRVASARKRTRHELGIDDSEVLILYVGSLIPRKGIRDLVRAWELLGDRWPVRLLMIGRARAAEESKLVADLVQRDHRSSHVDSIPYEDVPRYFHASDIFCFPTHLEGWGIVLGEAMACRLPVVTTKAKGVRHVVQDGQTALVADVGRPDQLARLLERLLADPGLRRRLGEHGRETVDTVFSWEHSIDMLVDALTNGTGSRP